MSGKIFLNYRREDSRWPTLSLYNLLAQGFPREQLFMDVEGYIRPGDDFVEVLEEQVSVCEVMIVVIGPQWLSLADNNGSPRIADPRDFVHIEIATALARKIRVIPVLVDGASMPRASELPEPLKALTRRQAIRISHDRFNADGQGLVQALQEAIGEAPTIASPLEFVFPNECNAEHAESRFRQSANYLPNGQPAPERVAFHQYFVGIKNCSLDKTLRNVDVAVEVVSGCGPTWPRNIQLVSENYGTNAVNLQPQKMELFRLGSFYDSSTLGMSHVKIVPPEQLNQVLASKREFDKLGVGFLLDGANEKFPLFKNDGYKVHVSAYADDCVPISAIFSVNARNKVEVLLDQ